MKAAVHRIGRSPGWPSVVLVFSAFGCGETTPAAAGASLEAPRDAGGGRYGATSSSGGTARSGGGAAGRFGEGPPMPSRISPSLDAGSSPVDAGAAGPLLLGVCRNPVAVGARHPEGLDDYLVLEARAGFTAPRCAVRGASTPGRWDALHSVLPLHLEKTRHTSGFSYYSGYSDVDIPLMVELGVNRHPHV